MSSLAFRVEVEFARRGRGGEEVVLVMASLVFSSSILGEVFVDERRERVRERLRLKENEGVREGLPDVDEERDSVAARERDAVLVSGGDRD